MGEIASAHVSIYPKFAANFGKDITSRVGTVGEAAGVKMGQGLGDGVAKQAPKVGQGISKSFAPILTLAAVGAVSAFVSSSVSSFAELEDATAAAGVVFGTSMGIVEKQATGAAQAMGISKTEATNAAITFGTFGKSAGLAGADLAGFSTEMVQLAGDMASFRGTSPEQAIQAIGAAMRGEAEPIRQFGVLLDDATLKNRALSMGLISTTKDALTPQVKVLAAQAEILAQTSDAQGDFARTSESTANTQKILAAESANLSAEIGEKLAPAIVAAQKAGIGFLKWTSDNMAVLAPLAGMVGTAALAVGGFVAAAKGIEAVKAARATIAGLGDAFSGMSSKARAASIAAGGIVLALTVAAGVYGMWAQQQERAKAQTEAFTESLRADSGALGENTRAAVANQIASAEIVTTAAKMGISADALTDAVMGNSAAYDYVTQRMRDYMAANADTEGAISGAKIEMDAINGVLGDMSGRLTQTQANYDAYAIATGVATTATTSATTATEKATTAQKEYLEEIAKTATAQLALSGSQIGLEAAIDGATAAVERNGKSLDIGTTKGRENRTALDQIATAGLGVVKSMEEAGRSSDDVKTAMDKSRTAFIKAATSMGMSKDKAKELADQLGLIKSKDIHVNVKWGTLPNALKVYTTAGGVKFQAAHGSKVPGVAAHDRDDKVPSLLTPDEWVIQRPSTRYYGDRVMSAINAARIPREVLQGYATGGRVGSVTSGDAPTSFGATQPGDIAAAIREALNGARLELSGADAFSDTLEARIVTSIRRA